MSGQATAERPLSVKDLAEASGYPVYTIRMAKRAGYRAEYPSNRSTVGHFLKWMSENPEFRPHDYNKPEFSLRAQA